MDRDRGSVKDGQQNGRVIVNGNASTSTSTNTNTTTPRHSGNIATQQRADQAVAILANEQLMLRYALANDLVSSARFRMGQTAWWIIISECT